MKMTSISEIYTTTTTTTITTVVWKEIMTKF